MECIEQLLEQACRYEQEPIGRVLKDKVIGLLFMNPSLRTLSSFQAGVAQLGGATVVIQPGSGTWALETRDGVRMDGVAVEHVREAIPVLAEYFDGLGVRCFAEGKDLETDLADGLIKKMAGLCSKPFFNMESAVDHPCQALADWKTLDDLGIPKSGKFVLSWAYHPKPLPYAVPNAALSMAQKRGMETVVLCPNGYDLPADLLGDAKICHDQSEALNEAHVLYCKSWCRPADYGDPESEVMWRGKYVDWMVRESWFRTARPEAKFMHCLPVRRNVKVSDEVLDGPRSVVIKEAGNRLHVQKAMLAAQFGGERS